jgi:hypothetical protein
VDRTPFTEDLDLSTVRSREDLAEFLRILHARADSPSLRELSRWSVANGKPALAKTTVSEMLAGKRLPRKGAVLAFVEACGIPPEQLEPWQRTWERLAPADVARPTLRAELRRLRQEAINEAEIRAAEIIAGAEARAALLLSEAAAQGPDQDLKQRMVQVWVGEERVKQTLADAERHAQAIIVTAMEQAATIRLDSEERLEREQAELGRIRIDIVEQTTRLKAINAAVAEALNSKDVAALPSAPKDERAERSRDAAPAEPRDWHWNPEVQGVRDAYDALVSMFRIDVERQIRLQGRAEE